MLSSPSWDSPDYYDDPVDFPSLEFLDIRRLSGSPDMASETSDGTFSMPSTASTVVSTAGSSSNPPQFTGFSPSLPSNHPHHNATNSGYPGGRRESPAGNGEGLVDFNNHSIRQDPGVSDEHDLYKQGKAIPYPTTQRRVPPVDTMASSSRQYNPGQHHSSGSPFGFSPFGETNTSDDFLAQLDSEFRSETRLLPSAPGESLYDHALTSPLDYSQTSYLDAPNPHGISPTIRYRQATAPADVDPKPQPIAPPIATINRAHSQEQIGSHSSQLGGRNQSMYEGHSSGQEPRGVDAQEPPKEEPRKTGRKLPKPTTDLLRKWLLDHADHPYPNEAEKKMLCAKTDLTIVQLGNWMINARRRILAPAARAQAAMNAGTSSDSRARLPGAPIAPNPSSSSGPSMINRPQLSPHQITRSLRGVGAVSSTVPSRAAPYPQRSYTSIVPSSLPNYGVKAIISGGRTRANSNSILPVPGAPSYEYHQRERMAPFPSGGIGVGYDNTLTHRSRTPPPNLTTNATGASGSPTAHIVSPAVSIAASPFQPWSATTGLRAQPRPSRTVSYPGTNQSSIEAWYDAQRGSNGSNGAAGLADAYGLPPSSNDVPQERNERDPAPISSMRNQASRTHY